MDQPVEVIRLFEVVGDGFCTASEDGEKVYAAIKRALQEGKKVRLSFDKVEDLTSAFLNTAVGQLYSGEFPEEEIKTGLLPPIDVTKEQLFLLKRVVERAKEFFKEPERFNAATREVLGDDDDEKA